MWNSGYLAVLLAIIFGIAEISGHISYISKLPELQDVTVDLKINSECGGSLVGLNGVISYSLEQNLTGKEVCVWTIIAPRKKTIQLQLIEDGFVGGCSTPCQRIDVYKIHDDYGRPIYPTEPGLLIKTSGTTVYNIIGSSIIQIVFTNGFENPSSAKGFAMYFRGVGENSTQRFPIPKSLGVMQGSSGRLTYPDPIPDSDYVTLTLPAPPKGKRNALTLEWLGNHLGDSVYGCKLGRGFQFIVTEPHWSQATEFWKVPAPPVRFSECRDTIGNSTIYSTSAMVVSFFTAEAFYDLGFTISWQTIG